MSEYIFASQEKEREYKRLSLLQQSFDEKSHKHLLKAGLTQGMDVLEVGAGLGSIAAYMQEKVGPDGSVLAVDLDTRFVKETPYDVLQVDILDLDSSYSFDLIHMRYVLIHNSNAKAIIKKLFSLLKDNGRLVIEEPDFTLAKWIDAQDLEACKRVNLAICKLFELKKLKAYYGSTVHLDLKEVGFSIDENLSYLHLCSGKDDVSEVMFLSVSTLQDDYINTGLCSYEDIMAYQEASMNEDSLAIYYATIVNIAIKKGIEKEPIPCIEKKSEDGIYEARDESEIINCFALMQTLRPHLERSSFVFSVKEQIKEGFQLFYLRRNSEIVCLAGVKISTNLAWGKHLYISDLVSASTSLGYGKELLNYLKDMAGINDCKEVHLDSGVQRFEAHKFYLREDFKIASHHFSYKIEI